ncbi:hypothetical protein [Novosphingopyxis sp.]|uniref:hypothetical protein n=1 Tax=Novosphingopyxis sp. TaxID=2709690 RepID=UPI003B5AE500
MWGKSGKLNARLLFSRANGRQVRLTGAFDDKGVTGTAGVVGAIAFVTLAGFFMTGTSASFPKGGAISGFSDENVELAMEASGPAPMAIPPAAASTRVSAEVKKVASIEAPAG